MLFWKKKKKVLPNQDPQVSKNNPNLKNVSQSDAQWTEIYC